VWPLNRCLRGKRVDTLYPVKGVCAGYTFYPVKGLSSRPFCTRVFYACLQQVMACMHAHTYIHDPLWFGLRGTLKIELARIIYIRCMYGTFSRQMSIMYGIMYGVYVGFLLTYLEAWSRATWRVP
jgi:hypothetical protein